MALGQGPLLEAGLLRRLEQLQLSSKTRLAGTSHGERRSRHRGTSLQFVDYRQYTLGDDPRQVDWNAYGRTGHLFVKLFEDEAMLTVHLLVDVSRSMDWGEPNKLDAARRLAAALGYVALARFDRVYVASLDDDAGKTVGPIWGRDRAGQLFDALSALESSRPTDLDRALRAYATRGGRSPGLAIVISDFLSPTWEPGLRALLRHRYELAVIHLLAPEEVRPPIGEELRLVDRETGRPIEIHLDQVALDQYARRFAVWTGAIERFCVDHAAAYARVDSDTPIEAALFDSFRRRRVLA
jgi:uncharacterized protein (DUF58 family)